MISEPIRLNPVLFHRLIDLSGLFGNGQAGFHDGTFTGREFLLVAKDL